MQKQREALSLNFDFSLPTGPSGFPKAAVAIWDTNEKAFVVRFTPNVNFDQPSTISNFWFITLKAVSIKPNTTVPSDLLISHATCITCNFLEKRVLGNALELPILEICYFRSSDAGTSTDCLIYSPPAGPIPGSNSVRYQGPTVLESLHFRLEYLPTTPSQSSTSSEFPASYIETGALQLQFTAAYGAYGRLY